MEQDLLNEFDKEKEIKPYFSIQVIPIIISSVMSIAYYYIGYEYFLMWKKYDNPEKVVSSISYFSVASFFLMSVIIQTVIRYKFIRRSDIKYFVLKDDE